MSRSEYSEDYDDDPWNMIRWRGAVQSGIRGKRGQKLLKELEESLVKLPEQRLIQEVFAHKDQVCAFGAVALDRKMKTGSSRAEAMAEIVREWPIQGMYDFGDDGSGDEVSKAFDISNALAREIMYVNDEHGPHNETSEQRYERVLKWVRERIKT